MANPNILKISQMLGKTVGASLTTSAATIVTNPAGSNKVLRINTITVANISATNTLVTVTANVPGAIRLAKDILISAGTSTVIVHKETAFYVEEGGTITALANANSRLELLCSYEELF